MNQQSRVSPLQLFSSLGVVRPNFLVLTPICLSLGVASSLLSGSPIHWTLLSVILLAALMAHTSVNALNEYGDFQSGLDLNTERTPFSGGSGTQPQHPELAPQALRIGVVSLTVTILCGLYLVWQSGWELIPLGLTGVLVILLYTGPINRNRYLVLVVPGLAFGPIMVLGTEYALTGEFTEVGVIASLLPFFLVNNLLLLNQFPDVQADRQVGRDNFVISLSTAQSALIYGGFGVAAYLTIVFATLAGIFPASALLGLTTAFLAYQVYSVARRYSGVVDELIPSMGKNVMVTLLTPLLLAIGIGCGVLI